MIEAQSNWWGYICYILRFRHSQSSWNDTTNIERYYRLR